MIIEVLAYISLVILSIRFVVTFVNFISNPVLPAIKTDIKKNISILIPARNEENNIGRLLEDLIGQTFPHIKILVYNDASEDHTSVIVKKYMQTHHHIKLIEGNELPRGWLGKNYACYQLAQQATGNYFLFVDADVRLKPEAISQAVDYITKNNLKLLSLFPVQYTHSLGEKMTVQVMKWILLSFLPMFMIRICRWKSFSAANGQFMLFDAENYMQEQWHEQVKDKAVEDIQIMRRMKKKRYRVNTLLGNINVGCRMYSNFYSAVKGFSKNTPDFFGGSILVAIFFAFFLSFGVIFVIANVNLLVFILFISLSVLLNIMIAVLSKNNIAEYILLIPLKILSFTVIVVHALYYRITAKGKWKDRIIKI